MNFVFHRNKWSKRSNISLVIFLILFTQSIADLAHPFQLGQAIKDEIENIKNEIDRVLQLNPEPLKRYKRGELSPTTDKTNKRLKTLEKEVYEMRQYILKLNESLTLNQDDRIILQGFESKINDLWKLVDNKNESLAQERAKAENSLQYIVQLLMKCLTKIDYMRRSALFDDVVRLILSHELTLANEKLQQASDTNYIYTYAVEKVYNNQAGNFDLLLRFGDSIPDIEHKFKVYNALYYKIKTNRHEDIRNLVRLNRSIKKEILDRKTDAIAAQSLFGTLNDEIKDAAVGPISAAFLNDDSWPMVKQLSTDIKDICLQCLGDIDDKVIDNVLEKVGTLNLLVKTHKNLKTLEEHMLIHLAVSNKLKSNGASYADSALSFADYLNLSMADSNYPNVNADLRNRYEDIKNQFPETVKYMVFPSRACPETLRCQEDLWMILNFREQSNSKIPNIQEQSNSKKSEKTFWQKINPFNWK